MMRSRIRRLRRFVTQPPFRIRCKFNANTTLSRALRSFAVQDWHPFGQFFVEKLNFRSASIFLVSKQNTLIAIRRRCWWTILGSVRL